ncbi:MAG: tRNA lysidine(34) synthetase TilS [Pyrinomonadaceae bacterium]
MHEFTRNLLTEWRKLNLPFADETFVVAVSGGADSISLMLALDELRRRKKLNSRFVVAHFNHNLRGAESDADENFVKEIAAKFNFELACGIQNPESKIENQKGNLEQNARKARYNFLVETAHNVEAFGILTAHTLNDQAETFLINLIRGSGLDGLGGMKPIRMQEAEERTKDQTLKIEDENSAIRNPQSAIRLVRPLLRWTRREDTENFCLLNKIEFRYDAMNEDLKFSRVRIRKILLPMLKDFNPKIIETLARTSDLLREGAEQLADGVRHSAEVEEDAETRRRGDAECEKKIEQRVTLSLKDLKDVFPSVRKTVLRQWLKENRGNLRRLELKHIEAVERLALSRKSGRVVELPNGETVRRENGKLHFQKTKVEK